MLEKKLNVSDGKNIHALLAQNSKDSKPCAIMQENLVLSFPGNLHNPILLILLMRF